MFPLKRAVALLVIFTITDAAKLPSYFSPCKRDETLNDCIVKSGNAGLSEFVKGDPSVHVVSLEPLHVNEMFIDVDGNLKINLTDAVISGLEATKLKKVNWDWENKKVNLDLEVEKTNLVGNYDIDGRILILPIRGKGPCNITYVGGYFKFAFDYEIEQRNGKEYVKPTKAEMTYDVERAYFKLDNLFDGDKRLGAEMSKFLDENWKEVNGEIGVRVGHALAQVFKTILYNFMHRVPLENLMI